MITDYKALLDEKMRDTQNRKRGEDICRKKQPSLP